ncbi:MAG: hypothetical protein ACOX86_00710 [Pelotomaculaceae bacterium]|uniref:Uncharacterized protein n=1 Tax=anaerobic digester metagenome TaxID=1263854 RepID=A0A485M2Y7_9ZZZZ|nr:hypothetical protein [Bacillota bacterium]HHU87615.1 hypothetical protein [Peptococcaceae bacterium]
MRRFIMEASNCLEEDLRVWQDAGFQIAEPGLKQDPRQRPDLVILRHWPEQGQLAWTEIKHLFPRVLIIISEQEILFPEEVSTIYNRYCFVGKSGLVFSIGSTLEGKIEEPDWEAYRFGDQPTRTEENKAVAGTLYRYLLLDVFRETAEWCGHMSSVVGPA